MSRDWPTPTLHFIGCLILNLRQSYSEEPGFASFGVKRGTQASTGSSSSSSSRTSLLLKCLSIQSSHRGTTLMDKEVNIKGASGLLVLLNHIQYLLRDPFLGLSNNYRSYSSS